MIPKIQPKEDCVFKFVNPGDRLRARFIGRRVVKTKSQDLANVLDLEILESVKVTDDGEEREGPIGKHAIFESTHVTRLLDETSLESGDTFILNFHSLGDKNFKRFALQKLSLDAKSKAFGSKAS